MAFKISGFGGSPKEEKTTTPIYETYPKVIVPCKSLMQIRFPGKGMALAYYNDRFYLKIGDRVYTQVLYFKNAVATFSSFAAAPETVEF